MTINKALIAALYLQGYKQKVICIITGYNQPVVSKTLKALCNDRLSVQPSQKHMTLIQQEMQVIVDWFLNYSSTKKSSDFSLQDSIIVNIMHKLMVSKETIMKAFPNVTKYKIAAAFKAKNIYLYDFDWLSYSQDIGVDHEIFNLLIQTIGV